MTEELGFHKKRRAVVRTSLTKLSTKLAELEAYPGRPAPLESARNLAEKLKTLQQDFKTHQLAIIDRTEEEDMEEELQALGNNDDLVSDLDVRIQRLMNAAIASGTPDTVRVATKQLTLLLAKLASIETSVHDLDDHEDDEKCVLEEYKDQVVEIKGELSKLKMTLLNSEATPDDPVMHDQTRAEKAAFDCLVVLRKRLHTSTVPPAAAREVTVTKLPKLGTTYIPWGHIAVEELLGTVLHLGTQSIQYSQGRKADVLAKCLQRQGSQKSDCWPHEVSRPL